MELRNGHGETPFRRTLFESMCKANQRMASHISAPEISEHVVYAAGVLVNSMASYTDLFREGGNELYSMSHPICLHWTNLTISLLS